MKNEDEHSLAVFEQVKTEYEDGKRKSVKRTKWRLDKKIVKMCIFLSGIYLTGVLFSEGAQAFEFIEKIIDFFWPEGLRNSLKEPQFLLRPSLSQ